MTEPDGVCSLSVVTTKELHIAPMLHVSTVEFRELFRILSRRCIIWTEMIVDETLVHNLVLESHLITNQNKQSSSLQRPPEHLLPPARRQRKQGDSTVSSSSTRRSICQLGGIRPDWTAIASRLVVSAGYDHEINLNLDCPSSRVQGKQFGAVLLKDVEKVRELLLAMKGAGVPISVKMRVGIIDDTTTMTSTDFQWLVQMVERLSSVCQRFVIHARAVVLNGLLSPEQNRNVPPLNYPFVYELCHKFPHLDFWINGGINNLKSAKTIVHGIPQQTIQQSTTHSLTQQHHRVPCTICGVWNGSCIAPPIWPAPSNLRGCLLGRAAMDHPAQFWDIDRYFYGKEHNPCQTRRQILDAYCTILEELYPRRCCDENVQVTCQLPSPTVVHTRPHCDICRELTNANDRLAHKQQQQELDRNVTIKISTHVLDRSFKPFLGMFFGLPGCRAFRRQCDELSRNINARNCGPAFVLRLAVYTTISNAILDQPLVRTEDLRC